MYRNSPPDLPSFTKSTLILFQNLIMRGLRMRPQERSQAGIFGYEGYLLSPCLIRPWSMLFRNKNSIKSQGFTLIELMVVVAIVAILSMLAVPAYRDYINRSQVAEGLNLVGNLKPKLVAYYAKYRQCPTVSDLGGSLSGKFIASLQVNALSSNPSTTICQFAATLKSGAAARDANIDASLAGKKLYIDMSYLNNETELKLSCPRGSGAPSDAVPEKYLPSAC